MHKQLRSAELPRLTSLIWFVPALVVLLFWPRLFPLDDAYITMYNARSLLGHGDQVFGGSPLLGASSAVHLMCVSLLGLVLPLPTAALAISAICSCLYAWGLWRLKPHWAFVAVGLLSSLIPIHLLNGLETSMALAAVTWSFVLVDSKWLPLLLGLLPYIRPDLMVLALSLGIRQARTQPLGVAALGLASALPFAIWYFFETGLPFPNTAQAKVVFFGEYSEPLSWKLQTVGRALLASNLLILVPGLFGLARSKGGWCGLIYMAGVLLVALVMLPSSLHFNDSRYLATFVPIFCYGLASLPEFVIYALAAAGLVSGTTAALELRDEFADSHQWFDAAKFIASLPAGSTVLVHDVGIAAWAQPKARLVDVVGLKSRSSVAIMQKYKVRKCEWGQALAEIARRSHANYAAVLQAPMWECVGTNLTQAGWTLTPVHTGAVTVFAIRPPPAALDGRIRHPTESGPETIPRR